jgi:hypothetical protein
VTGDQLRSRLQSMSALMTEPSQFERATRFRNSAAACGMFAANAVSPSDRDLLLRMQRSWLERAHYEDWVNGLPPIPPAGARALAVPRH